MKTTRTNTDVYENNHIETLSRVQQLKISFKTRQFDTLKICSWGPQSLSFKSLLTDGTILVKLEQLLSFEPSATRQAAESEKQDKVY